MDKKIHFFYGFLILVVGLGASFGFFSSKHRAIALEEQKIRDNAIERDARQRLRDFCFEDAQNEYNSFMELNGEKKELENGEFAYSLNGAQQELMRSRKNDAEELCIKKYPI